MANAENRADALADLTAKQKEVLDLLVKHKTSKEIARILDISPFTVDQRITAARQKFGAESRNELAEAYMEARGAFRDSGIYQPSVYQFSQVETSTKPVDKTDGSGAEADDPAKPQGSTDHNVRHLPVVDYRVVPESFEGRYGAAWRIAAIVAITLALLIAILVGFAIYGELSAMLR